MTRQPRGPWRRRRIERYEEAHLSVSSSEAKAREPYHLHKSTKCEYREREVSTCTPTGQPLGEGPRRRRRIDVPRRGTPSTQRSVRQLCKAPLHIGNRSEAVGSLPHSYASKYAGRETKARYYMQYEQPLGEGARRRRRIDVPRRGTLLRSGQYGNCAKRYSMSSTEAKP